MKTNIHNAMQTDTHDDSMLSFTSGKPLLLAVAALMILAAGARAQFVSTVVSNLAEPNGVATDSSENAYITDTLNHRILKYVPSAASASPFVGLEGYSGTNAGTGAQARFNNPLGIVAARGGLVVVDQGNQLIRFVSLAGVVSSTPLAGVAGKTGTNNGAGTNATFSYPIGIAADAKGDLYIADTGNNLIREIDTSSSNNVTTVAITNGYQFLQPEGVAVDNNGNVWVTETGRHDICVISNQSVYVVAGVSGSSGFDDSISAASALFSGPTAILYVSANNSFLIADTGNSVIRSLFLTNEFGPTNYVVQTVAGIADVKGTAGGSPDTAEFIAPVALGLDPYDSGYYIVDRGTLSGTLRSFQLTAPLPAPSAPVFGYVTFVSPGAGSPAVSQFNATSDAVFNNTAIIAIEAQANTQTFITSGATGSAIPLPGPSSGSSPEVYQGNGLTYAAPTIVNPLPSITIYAVSEGPGGQLSSNVSAVYQFVTANPTITGNNAAALQLTDTTVGAAIYYTLDGNIPTNGASDAFGPYYSGDTLSLVITNNVTLSVRAFTNNFAPSGVSSIQLTLTNYVANTIGFAPKTTKAGTGATLAVPIYVTMAQSNTPLLSMEFRAEVAPTAGNTNVTGPLNILSFSPGDYYPLTSSVGGTTPFIYYDEPYVSNSAEGLVIYTFTNNVQIIQGYGAVSLVEVPIPNTVSNGQTYSMSIIFPSGTTDGNQAGVAMIGATNTLTITDPVYFAGDSSPANGYNAGEFGDGSLDNSDVNNAMYASVGIRVPPVFTDAYNAMDVYPPDNGDGQITMLDWNTTLNRAVGLDTNNWIRFRTNGGTLMHQQVSWTPDGTPIPLSAAVAMTSVQKLSSGSTPPGSVWHRQAVFGGDTQTNVAPGASCSIPVYVKVKPGSILSGAQFRAILSADGSAPAPGGISFTPAAGIPTPTVLPGLSSNDIACFWPMGSFPAGLQGSNYLGVIKFNVPSTAQTGQSYALHFSGVDGAPNMQTLYQLESFPAFVWINSAALLPPSITSDEWKLAFFGSLTSSLAADNIDADGDGMPNWQEYLAGTNPTNAASCLQFTNASFNSAGLRGIAINWLTAPGKTYTLKSGPALNGTNWTVINTNVGDGNYYQFLDTNYTGSARFYQLRVNP
jgi:sugar lactone lactonase YvrE